MHRVGEIALISKFLAPLAFHPGSFGLTDDAALLTGLPASGLVITTDALVAGVHFFDDDAPGDVAYKALAVNVSDLSAKGARPIAYTLSLALTEAPDEIWATGFAEGLRRAQTEFGIGLVGGDTVSARGAWWLSVTAIGQAASRGLVPRGGAKPGDALYVSGTLGDSALGLRLRLGQAAFALDLSEQERQFLLHRYLYPRPRLSLAAGLAAYASAAMDISDGLALDLSRMCQASTAGAEIRIADIPLSPAVRNAVRGRPDLIQTVLTGGDDYEILAAIPCGAIPDFEQASRNAGITVSRVGTVTAGLTPPRFMNADGSDLGLSVSGYEHFQTNTDGFDP